MGGSRKTVAVLVGTVSIGGDAPIRVQSMTDTDTEDDLATAIQIAQLYRAGSELVRITVNTDKAARQVPKIWERLQKMGIDVPIVGDFHYNGHHLLPQYPECAQLLAKYRINPGNIGHRGNKDSRFAAIIEVALRYGKAVRIGANWGSIDQSMLATMMDRNARKPEQKRESNALLVQKVLVKSALDSAKFAESVGLRADRIIVSCKVSQVDQLVAIYRDLSKKCTYPLHVGLTEAGLGAKGIVCSTAALAILLNQGIGDTIRVSLTPQPDESRTKEVTVAQHILQSLGLRAFTPMVTSCPGCGRTGSDYFRRLAMNVQNYVREKMTVWREEYCGVEHFTLAVMGCVVNGPGESKHANLGISLPGRGENVVCPVFADGEKIATLRGDDIEEQFKAMIDQYVKKTYSVWCDAVGDTHSKRLVSRTA